MITNKNTTSTQLTCEQVYNLWATEPYLINILDARSLSEFEKSHIPGAQFIRLEDIVNEITQHENKLAVIIASEGVEKEIEKDLHGRVINYVFMKDCHRWADLHKPLAGQSLNSVLSEINNFNGDDMRQDIVFHQLYEPESSTYTYIIADKKSKEAAIIDPVLETVDRDLKLIKELGLNLIYVLDTHIHADHITAAGEIRKHTKAKTAVSSAAGVSCVDIPLEDGQELLLGTKKIKILSTPGHTNTCMTYYFEGMLFTGDSLMIRGCGRTDFQQGSVDNLYHSVHHKLYKLPEETIVYPGHDYRGQTASTIALERKYNARLSDNISKENFSKIMAELKLENPKKIHEALPANMACGLKKTDRVLHPQVVDSIPEVTCEDVLESVAKVRLIDVRMPDEFNGELGHIQGSELITLGPDLTAFLKKANKDEEIVFVCRSGGRSGTATIESINLGFKKTMNLVGGMIRWNQLDYKVERK